MAITVQRPTHTATPPLRAFSLGKNVRALGGAIFGRLAGAEIARRVQLAVAALDDARDAVISGQGQLERDRFSADREEILREALLAWRTNPLAKRIVALTTQYVIGDGLSLESPHPATNAFIKRWWNHRLNRMPVRIGEWCDELTRAGNLIVLVSTDAAGFSYVRALPASQVQTIVTRPNDVEQPVAIVEKAQWGKDSRGAGERGSGGDVTFSPAPLPPSASADLSAGGLSQTWPVYDEASDHQNPDGTFPTVALHYAINRPVAAAWGESDLAPLLRWLARYSNWLEDRARLNRYRQAFMYVVSAAFQSKADRLARQAEINANPPAPGAVLVKDNGESWGVIQPALDSHDAGEDGLALKKMISAGSGNPLHFLAEPESATRTTAEAAGGPTFRHYEQRQRYFLWLLGDVLQVVLNRRALVDPAIRRDEPLAITGSDISVRDNATLAQAAGLAAGAFGNLRDRQLIDDTELLRLVYKFSGEVVDVQAVLRRGQEAGDKAPNGTSARE